MENKNCFNESSQKNGAEKIFLGLCLRSFIVFLLKLAHILSGR